MTESRRILGSPAVEAGSAPAAERRAECRCAECRCAEEFGYDVIPVPDRLGMPAPLPAPVAATLATEAATTTC
ncbi:hypothetical protein [Streptomyces sp. NPDC058964]|uniref:hypothetical protein n=1 Tax=Streptomyces sp. NPDC058964 TaxID=3346681 RepID=UPI0036A311DD